MANASPAARLGRECVYGLVAGAAFGALLLVFNIGDLWDLSRHSLLSVAIVLISAIIAFEPVIICTCIGGWRAGVQEDHSDPPEV
jgi:hypothetical protein